MKLSTLFLVVALFFKGVLLSAQTCDSMDACDCALTDLSPAGIVLGHEHPKGVWKISYSYMSMMMDGNLSGTKKADDNFVFNNYIMSPQNMRMDMHMVMAMYGLTNRLSLMAMFNYNAFSMNMNILPGTTMIMNGAVMTTTADNSNVISSKTSGLGDTKLYAEYSLLKHNVQHLLLYGGVNLPTGNIQMKGRSDDSMYPSDRFPYVMQMGSGTIDFMPGITYLLKQDKASFSTQISSVIRPFNNSLNYHLGNEFTLNVWAAYQWFPWISASVRMEGSSVEKIVGYDPSLFAGMEPSASPLNYGGQEVKSFIGLNFYLKRGFLKNNKFSVEYGMPLYQDLNGIQLAVKSTVYAGWLITF